MPELVRWAYFNRLKKDIAGGHYWITNHARIRMSERGISTHDLEDSARLNQIELVAYQRGRDPKLRVRCVRQTDGKHFNATFALVPNGAPELVTVEPAQ